MLLIVIVALIATSAFYRQAKIMNAHPGEAASIPFIAAGLLLIIGCCTSFGLDKLAASEHVAPATTRIMWFMANVFLVLAYLLLIRRNWLALTASKHRDTH